MVAAYRMAELLDLESLITLSIEAWPRVRVTDRHGVENVLVDCMPLVERVAEWLRSGFRSRRRAVEVRVVEAGSPGLRWDKRGVV